MHLMFLGRKTRTHFVYLTCCSRIASFQLVFLFNCYPQQANWPLKNYFNYNYITRIVEFPELLANEEREGEKGCEERVN